VRRAVVLVPALAAVLAAAGCGTPSPDLFVVKRTGTVPGAKLNLLVSDTTARCNNGPLKQLTSAQTLDARDILKNLLDVQSGNVAVQAAPPFQIFDYTVQTEQGSLTFADTAQRPPILPRLALFTRRVAIDTCGLTR
jgi:hypothetical protein